MDKYIHNSQVAGIIRPSSSPAGAVLLHGEEGWFVTPLHRLSGVEWHHSEESLSFAIESNQITFIVTSPQHKCLGEWNSYECAPDSAEKQQTIYIWTDSAKKQQTIYIWTDSAKKLHWSIYSAPDSAKKQQTIYIWTDSAKKQQQFTYGQYIFTDCTEDNVQNTHTYTQYT